VSLFSLDNPTIILSDDTCLPLVSVTIILSDTTSDVFLALVFHKVVLRVVFSFFLGVEVERRKMRLFRRGEEVQRHGVEVERDVTLDGRRYCRFRYGQDKRFSGVVRTGTSRFS